jgi:hypothetical protein
VRLFSVVRTLESVRADVDYILSETMAKYHKWPSPTTLRRLAAQLNTLADDIDAWVRSLRQGRLK